MHTNETVNYKLSQFVGTDIPNPLVDYNGDMEKIDTAIKDVADAAVAEESRVAALEAQNGNATLDTTAQTLSGAVNELKGGVDGLDTRLTTAEGKIITDESTLATAVNNISTLAGKTSALETKVGSAVLITTASDLSGAVNELANEIEGTGSGLASRVSALEAQNGNEVLVTTAQTLSGAINEIAQGGSATVDADNVTYDNTTSGLTATNVQAAIDEVAAGTGSADNISYSNTTSGLTATNVQDAIDELAQGGSNSPDVTVTGDGTKTLKTILNEIANAIDFTKFNANSKVVAHRGTEIYTYSNYVIDATNNFIRMFYILASSVAWGGYSLKASTTLNDCYAGYYDTSWHNQDSQVVASGDKFEIYY